MNKNSEEKLTHKLGIIFKNPSLFHTALVHRSFLNEEKNEQSSNERLEFLGDAVLEFVVSGEIYRQYPKLDEGKLTALRSRLVNTTSLAKISESLGIGGALYLSRGEVESGGRKNLSLLADAFEAIIGAIFIDQGIEKACEVIKNLVLPQARGALSHLKDAKSLLQEIVQSKGNPAPIYKVLDQKGPDHARTFTVGVFVNQNKIATGIGKSKQLAEQDAAKNALATLQ